MTGLQQGQAAAARQQAPGESGTTAVLHSVNPAIPRSCHSLRATCALIALALLASSGSVAAQARRPPARRAAPPAPAPALKTEVPEMVCPAPLGAGVTTKRAFCDVMTGRDPAGGIIITLPPHRGPVALTFDLHNRQTYSEEQMKDPRLAFSRYVASIGVLTMDNTLVKRAAVENEFRTAADLLDRIGGGAGPAGVKAVAPTGLERIRISIPEAENQVSILGEQLLVERADGSVTYTSPGRPIAIISNVEIEYRPAPAAAPRPPARAPVRRPRR
jgi:hypothetical protein